MDNLTPNQKALNNKGLKLIKQLVNTGLAMEELKPYNKPIADLINEVHKLNGKLDKIQILNNFKAMVIRELDINPNTNVKVDGLIIDYLHGELERFINNTIIN